MARRFESGRVFPGNNAGDTLNGMFILAAPRVCALANRPQVTPRQDWAKARVPCGQGSLGAVHPVLPKAGAHEAQHGATLAPDPVLKALNYCKET